MMSKNKNLNNLFLNFLIPSIFTAVAISLNEFVDGIVVAHLLGSDAMAILNVGMPILLLYSMFGSVAGIGGSVKYASFIGELKNEKAGEVFSLSLLYSAVISLFFVILGIFFNTEVANLLSSQINYGPHYYLLVRIMLLSAPIIMITLTSMFFLPVAGKPEYTTVLIAVSNTVNLIFDYILIQGFSMGVEGSALATTVGYTLGAIIVILMVKTKKVSLETSKISDIDKSLFMPIVMIGIPSAIGQLSFVVKTYFGNFISSSFCGIEGLTSFSACMQTMSMTGIVISGLVSTIIPIIGLFYGQRDFSAIKTILDMAMKIQVAFSILIFILMEIFPGAVLAMFNIHDPQLVQIAVNGLQIFSALYLFRGTIVLFISYSQIIERKVYSIVLSILDGFGALIVLTYILTPTMGLDGLWFAFVLSELLILIGTIIINYIIKSRSNLEGYFLVEKADGEVNQIIDFDEGLTNDDSTEISEFVSLNNLDSTVADNLESITNEILDYINRSGQKKKGCLELNLKVEDNLKARFRSLEEQPNLEKYDATQDNIMGMNYAWVQLN